MLFPAHTYAKTYSLKNMKAHTHTELKSLYLLTSYWNRPHLSLEQKDIQPHRPQVPLVPLIDLMKTKESQSLSQSESDYSMCVGMDVHVYKYACVYLTTWPHT